MNKGFFAISTLILIAIAATVVAGGTYGAYKYSETVKERDSLREEISARERKSPEAEAPTDEPVSLSNADTESSNEEGQVIVEESDLPEELSEEESFDSSLSAEIDTALRIPEPEVVVQPVEPEVDVLELLAEPEVQIPEFEAVTQTAESLESEDVSSDTVAETIEECNPNGKLIRDYRDWRKELFETEQDFERNVEKLEDDRAFITEQSVGFEGIISNLAETAYDENRDAITAAENLNIAAGERADVLSTVIHAMEACESTSEMLDNLEENTEHYNSVVGEWNKEYGEANEAFGEFIEALGSYYF